jgi:hypothetical protein
MGSWPDRSVPDWSGRSARPPLRSSCTRPGWRGRSRTARRARRAPCLRRPRRRPDPRARLGEAR